MLAVVVYFTMMLLFAVSLMLSPFFDFRYFSRRFAITAAECRVDCARAALTPLSSLPPAARYATARERLPSRHIRARYYMIMMLTMLRHYYADVYAARLMILPLSPRLRRR